MLAMFTTSFYPSYIWAYVTKAKQAIGEEMFKI